MKEEFKNDGLNSKITVKKLILIGFYYTKQALNMGWASTWRCWLPLHVKVRLIFIKKNIDYLIMNLLN